MRKVITLSIVLIFTLMSAGILFSQQNAEDEKFSKFLESYLDSLWKFYPTSATNAGYHKYDDKLEDLSSKNIEKRHEELDKFNQELVAKIDRQKLSPEYQIDHSMIVDALDRERLSLENLIPWDYNPLFYNRIFSRTIRTLITEESIPLETRAKNASERLKELPKFIKQAKDNLKTPAEIYTQTAIKQFPAILSFYKSELPQWIGQASSSSTSRMQSYLTKAIPALEDYQAFLQTELLARSTGNFRLGEAHRRLMQVTLQNNITLDELIARAKADYNNIRREMFLVCIPFFKIMDPRFNVEQPPANLTEEQLKNTVIAHVLDTIQKEHVSKESFLEKIKETVAEIKDAVLSAQIVDLPEETPLIEAMPPEEAGTSLSQLVLPAIYGTAGKFSLQIAPFSEVIEEEKIESLLEEYNDFLLPFWTVLNVYPGEFVPTALSWQNPSLVRKLFPNIPLIKGWSLLLNGKLIHTGYGNYDLRLRLNQLKFQLRAVIDFLLDFNIHEGGMTKEQAVAYMMRGGFQTQAEAERKWNEIILLPGNAAYAYVGMQELIDLENEYMKHQKESFSQKEFLEKVLSYGAISLRHLKSRILE